MSKVFVPTDFLSEVRLNSMEGTYVPFGFYDHDVNVLTRNQVSGYAAIF